MDADALLSDLDDDQRRAVLVESRLVAVIAGAGSGKTRVLTRRVAHRIATGDADPQHTVVLTFTREAAGELRRRLPSLGVTGRVTAGTFHSVAQTLLRQRWIDQDRRAPNLITDRRRIVGDIMGRTGLDALVADMDWATARGVTATGYGDAVRTAGRRSTIDSTRVAEALDSYRKEKQRRGIIDLDDLLGLTIEALEHDDTFVEATRWRFRHLLVDEAQDLNPLQHRIIDLLRAGRDDLYLVGDPAQAIYGFNGSDPGLLLDVSERFPGVEVIRLPVNHRCTPQIVDVGAHALTHDGQRSDIRSARADGQMVDVVVHDDERVEATRIAHRIAHLDPTLARTGSVAVLARTHAVLAPIRDALEAAGVAVQRNVDGPGSAIAPLLDQVYRLDSAAKLREWAHDEVEQDASDPNVATVDRANLASLHEVAGAILDFLREQPIGDGTAFRVWVRTTDPFGKRHAGVELLTFHGAKGREWHTVFLAGCETSLIPHRSATTLVARAEEARLLYVALTRATDVLVINWAERRNGYQRKPTPLLDDFESTTPATSPPPPEIRTHLHRSSRQVTLERLHAWRSTTARIGGILPSAVCSDTVLGLIADHRPSSAAELDQVTGMGAITCGRLFGGVAQALNGTGQNETEGLTS